MDINKVIGNVIKVLVVPKILYYRCIYNIKLPLGSIIYGLPKIRDGKYMKLGKGFQLGRLCRLMGEITIGRNFFMNEFGTISAGIKKGKITISNDVMIGPLFYMISGDHGFGNKETMNISSKGKSGY